MKPFKNYCLYSNKFTNKNLRIFSWSTVIHYFFKKEVVGTISLPCSNSKTVIGSFFRMSLWYRPLILTKFWLYGSNSQWGEMYRAGIFIVPLPVHLSACQVASVIYLNVAMFDIIKHFYPCGDVPVCRIVSCAMVWILTLISIRLYNFTHIHVISIPSKYGHLGIEFI